MTDFLAEAEINPSTTGLQSPQQVVMRFALDALTNFVEAEELDNPSYARDSAAYVACFSEKPDQLSQWRAYGGRGYSIGFTKAGLNSMTSEGEIPPHATVGDISQVGYGQPAIDQLWQDVVTHFTNRHVGNHPGTAGWSDTVYFLMPRLARIKHEAFKEEREWRSIVSRYNTPVKNVYFRYGVRLIPYVELQFDRSSVSEVYIGPGGDFHAKRALRAFLRVSGYDLDQIRIEHSSAPLRDSQTI
jgi:hypothetical protein